MTSTWTKQEVDKYDNHRLRFYLRKDSPYRSAEEYFAALLMMHGAPPLKPEERGAGRPAISFRADFRNWRERVAVCMNETLPCSIDPNMVMREYFKWLNQNWKKHSSSP